jgi:phytoene desaturase
MAKRALVVGAGFAGLAASTSLAAKGYDVTILEKNNQAGGRARSFQVSDYYTLERLDPSYRVYFGEKDFVDLPAGVEACAHLFNEIELGAGDKLRKFMRESAYKYEVGINDLVYRPGRSILEFADIRIAKGLLQLDLLKSMRKYVYGHFNNPRLRQLMEFPILFLGATPKNTPALYSLMNYADVDGGTWFPKGGMHKIVEGMVSLAEEQGVTIKLNHEVLDLKYSGDKITGLVTSHGEFNADVVVAAGDYNHFEQKILPAHLRQYSEKYWDKRAMAPSSLLFYMGVEKPVDGLLHHTLFFDQDFDKHADEIYTDPQWPSNPLFYASASSKTDASLAPAGKENLFLLMPVAPHLNDDDANRERYYDLMMERLERLTGCSVQGDVSYKRSYAHSNFIEDYHAFKGNAYGLANTLMQTAILKPAMKSKKVKNLYYAGQLTTPGPGVPPSLISGMVVADEIEKDLKD